MIDDQYIIEYFFKPGFFNAHQYKKMTNEIKEYLENRYSDSLSLKETIYRIKYNIDIHPICPVCGKLIPFSGHFPRLFNDHCSTKCSTLDKNVQKKLKQTKLEKYGDENYTNKEKSKQTSLEKYGCEHYTNREKCKQTKLERYGDEYYTNYKKSEETKLKKYGNIGYNNPEKTKKTCLEKYGTEFVIKADSVRKKIKQTCLEKYGVENAGGTEISLQHAKETWMNKYNTDNPMKVNEIQNKARKTCLKKYGTVCPLQNEKVKEKVKQTMILKYGVDHHMKNDLIKEKFNWDERNIKREKTLKENNSYNKSFPEETCYKLLKEKYQNIERQYKSELYPFNCDFYIPSIDTYIEYNGSQFHHFHPFNENNEKDIKELKRLQNLNKKNKRHKESKKSQYDTIIYVWTDLDIRKRKIAKENNLNFIEFWSVQELKDWLDKQ